MWLDAPWLDALTTAIAYGVIAVGLALMILGTITSSVWLTVVVVGLLRGVCAKCPRCRSPRIHLSAHQPSAERFLPRFICSLRCDHCNKRFFACQSIDYTT